MSAGAEGEETEMSAQPIHTDEQTTDPQVRARLMQAVEDVDRAMYRGRVTRAAQSGFDEYRKRKGL